MTDNSSDGVERPTLRVTPPTTNDATLPPLSSGTEPTLAPDNPALDSTIRLQSASGRIRYFGDYELLQELARGGMGVVYKAKQSKLNRLVALKMILAGQFAGEGDVRRFYAEAEAAANLDHPGIVPIFEVGEHEGQHFYSMGYIEGHSLADRVKDGPLTPPEAAELVRKVAEAIHYAHQRGVLHRDLKPANILIGQDGQPRVTDFGLAKRIEGDSNLTGTGQILGTPSYMPPEQAAGLTDQVGPHSDVYALGSILYCLLTGRPPFQAASPMDTLRQVVEQEPISPRRLNPRIDLNLNTICAKCLEKDPANRYASAEEVALELARQLHGEPIRARPANRRERAWRWAKRSPGTAAAIASCAVALAALTILLAGARRQNDLVASLTQEKQTTQQLGAVKRKLETAQVESDHALYLRCISLAFAAWKGGDLERAAALLEECPPDRREWEWHYVHRLCQSGLLTLRAHTDGVEGFSLDAAGKLLASSGEDGAVRVWSAEDGRELFSIPRREKLAAICVACRPDGGQIAIGRSDKTLWIFDVAARRETLLAKNVEARDIAYSPSGQQLAARTFHGIVQVFDVKRRQERRRIRVGRLGGATAVAFSSDGKLLACGSYAGVEIWSAESETLIFESPKENSLVNAVAFHPDGQQLVLGDEQGVVAVWSVAYGKRLLQVPAHQGAVTSVAYSATGDRFATGGADKVVKIWDAVTGTEMLALRGHTRRVRSVAITPDGQKAISASDDGTIKIWDAQQDRAPREFLALDTKLQVHSLAFSPEGKWLAIADDRTVFQIWDTETGRQGQVFRGHERLVGCIAYSRDGARLLSADHTLKLWDAKTGQVLRTITVRPSPVSSPPEISSEELLAKSPAEQFAYFLEMAGKKGDVPIVNAAFSPDGARIVSGDCVGIVRVWDISSGEELFVVHPDRPIDRKTDLTDYRNATAITRVAFSPDGQSLAGGYFDGTIKIWDAKTGREALKIEPNGEPARFAFSPDSQSLVAITGATVKLLSARTGEVKLTLRGHTNKVACVAFHPQGRRILTGGLDRSVRLWDAASGQEVIALDHAAAVGIAAFSPDGKQIVTASSDGAVKLWKIE